VKVYDCRCSRCAPLPVANQCSVCGQEVRHGVRDGVTGWWHRETVDHMTILGHRHTQADEDRRIATLDEVRYDDDFPEGYTIRERYRKVGDEGGDPEAEVIPAPEVTAEPVEKKSQWVPGGARTIWNLAEKNGWTVVSATRSRGPRVHASLGTLLSVSDFFLLKLRLDSEDRAAVASWCDGKFDFAYNVTIHRKTKTLTADKANSDGLKTWIKGDFV
jgi:hypothetical protein